MKEKGYLPLYNIPNKNINLQIFYNLMIYYIIDWNMEI
jgi:hypothetical protein